MDNFFICRYFDWEVRRVSYLDRMVIRAAGRLGLKLEFNSAHLLDRVVSRVAGRAVPAAHSGIMTNVEKRMNIYHLVSQVLAYGVEGDLVELGCHEGQTAALITKVMRDRGSSKTLFVYDSFEGLPAPGANDGTKYSGGSLMTTEEELRENFSRYGLPLPRICRGWFKDTLRTQLPERICFAHLDGDFYESILVSLEFVYPRLSPGAVCIIDDYCDRAINPIGWNDLPGVKKACDEFLADKPEKIEFLYSGGYSHGFFRKALRHATRAG
jgi:O-methyltransferase